MCNSVFLTKTGRCSSCFAVKNTRTHVGHLQRKKTFRSVSKNHVSLLRWWHNFVQKHKMCKKVFCAWKKFSIQQKFVLGILEKSQKVNPPFVALHYSCNRLLSPGFHPFVQNALLPWFGNRKCCAFLYVNKLVCAKFGKISHKIWALKKLWKFDTRKNWRV